ncbi:MAG: hypothetical protein IPI67_22525 [Myxococcales bacterium]|nr:hypothetical protein [Myxococcales bacterium]
MRRFERNPISTTRAPLALLLGLLSTLGVPSCAPTAPPVEPPRTEGAAPSGADETPASEAAARPATSPDNATDDGTNERPSTEAKPSLTEAIADFISAANSADDESPRSLATAACWASECRSFAQQAGKKFQARSAEPHREKNGRAVAGADVICPGDRKCDFVFLLFELTNGAWLVADVTEDDAKATAWVP